MRIEKALEHFKYKFQNVWKPTKTDIEAYNSIIDYKEIQEQRSISENESLSKLFIAMFISKCQYYNYSSEMALKSIEDILKKDSYYWVKMLHLQLPLFQIQALGFTDIKKIDSEDFNELKKHNDFIFDKYENEITKALGSKVSEEQLIKWLNSKINTIINTYDK